MLLDVHSYEIHVKSISKGVNSNPEVEVKSAIIRKISVKFQSRPRQIRQFRGDLEKRLVKK